jgi:hypothetical protein
MALPEGTVVRLKQPCLGNAAGTLGYVFDDYGTGSQVIFPNGEYDGFGVRDNLNHIDEIEEFLEVVGEYDLHYQFNNVMKLSRDFDTGYFKEIFDGTFIPKEDDERPTKSI